MNATDKDTLKQKIQETIVQTEQEIARLVEDTQPISPENSLGRVSRMDAINNKSVAEAALRSFKKKLGKLKLALTKIEEPSFGSCDFCKNPIAAKRLMFMPQSTRCVHCADKR